MNRAPAAAGALFLLSANIEFWCLRVFRTEAVNLSGSAHYFGFE